MAKKVSDIMHKEPLRVASSSPIADAARHMRASHVGAVIVDDGGRLCGIVTDRDIAIRAVAEGKDPKTTPISEICSKELVTISPDEDIDRAVQVMREKSVRRLLVVDGQNKSLGILSLGDLAIEKDARSVLGQISAAAPNQ
jgi:predicted transcriptional regulator